MRMRRGTCQRSVDLLAALRFTFRSARAFRDIIERAPRVGVGNARSTAVWISDRPGFVFLSFATRGPAVEEMTIRGEKTTDP